MKNSRFPPIAENIETSQCKFELVALAAVGNDEIHFFLRHGSQFVKSWVLSDNIFPNIPRMFLLLVLSRSWTHALFVQEGQAITRSHVLHYLGGQKCFKCQFHEKFLTVDVVQSKYSCSLSGSTPQCKRKSFYHCPVSDCSAAVCRHQFRSRVSEDIVVVDQAFKN